MCRSFSKECSHICLHRVWIRPSAPSCDTSYALQQPPAHLFTRQASLRPQHLWGTLRHHRHPQRRNVCVQGKPFGQHWSFDLSLSGELLVMFLFFLFRISGSGECVTTTCWMDTPCQLVTSGGVCPLISTLLLKGRMGNLLSLKVSFALISSFTLFPF